MARRIPRIMSAGLRSRLAAEDQTSCRRTHTALIHRRCTPCRHGREQKAWILLHLYRQGWETRSCECVIQEETHVLRTHLRTPCLTLRCRSDEVRRTRIWNDVDAVPRFSRRARRLKPMGSADGGRRRERMASLRQTSWRAPVHARGLGLECGRRRLVRLVVF